MKKALLIFSVLVTIVISSCKKSDNTTDTEIKANSINDIKVPAGFTWESSRNVNITVSVTDNRFKDAIHQITIYNGDPFSGGVELSQGSANINNPFTTKIYLSNQITELYVVKTAPDKSKLVQKITADKTDLAVSIGASDPSLNTNSASNGLKVQDTAPVTDCNSGCTLPVVTTSKSDVDINNGDVLCITGSNITVNFRNINGGTIRVCGSNVTIQNLNLSGSATLLISASGSVNLSNGFNFNSSSASLVNYGTVSVSGSFTDHGIFTNNGIFTCGGDFNLNGQAGIFTNNGTMTVGGSFQDGTSSAATNNSSITVGGNFQPNGNSNFINKCSLIVGGNYTQSSDVKNYSLIKVGGTTTINGNKELGMYNSAMLLTSSLIVDGLIKGYGSTSFIKITGNTTTIRNSGSVVANIQIYAIHGIDASSAGHIGSGATQDNTVYIPQTGCNGEGNGTPAITDTDNDTVADNLDAYPTDPTKAYNVTGATGTLAFEDQWPRKGDYDLNDLVISYAYTLITNAANKVVQVKGDYILFATGGDYSNAFAVEFPVSRASASGLTITGPAGATSENFEANQAKAVVSLFTNMRKEMPTWNTKTNEAYTAPKTYSISFNVTNGPTVANFGLDAYNPFIYNLQYEKYQVEPRRLEVHLVGKAPSTLAYTGSFGTEDDGGTNTYYVTKTGLPYAINIPTAAFAYPVESTDITHAFLHFADWAQSGGLSYSNWYSVDGSGYRDADNIFHH